LGLIIRGCVLYLDLGVVRDGRLAADWRNGNFENAVLVLLHRVGVLVPFV
jgi:hypothetical protein